MTLRKRTGIALALAAAAMGVVPVPSPADPVTGWVSIFDPQNNTPRFFAGSDGTDSPITTDADQDSIAASIAPVTLLEGDSITLSGTVAFDVTLAGGQFRVGLFAGPALIQDQGNPYIGIYSEAPTGSSTHLKYGNGTHPDHPFGSGTILFNSLLPGGGGVAAGTPIDFSLTITRDGPNLDVAASFTDNAGYNRSGVAEDVAILSTAPGYTYTFNTAAFLIGGSMNGNRATFSNIQINASTPSTDTDGDGMPDSYEDYYGLNPSLDDAAGDLDLDELTNFQEYLGADGVPGSGDETAPNDPDSDDDLVYDGIEIVQGTDPRNPDTDDDGLIDGVENNTGIFADASHTGTNPLNPDSDGDGFLDGFEVLIGSDPTDSSSNPGSRLFGIEFNRSDALGSPSQSQFRIISGSATQAHNASSYTKKIGTLQVTVSQPNAVPLEFRGANTDSSRAIPGGDVSLSFLVADFIASREGAIDVQIANLPSGNYFFRSWHLDTFTGTGLGFAQGATVDSPNTIEARLGGVLEDSVQPTALSSAGLNTTFIDDSQIPFLGFSFTHDGSSPLTIELRSTATNGSNSFLLLNGFELFQSSL